MINHRKKMVLHFISVARLASLKAMDPFLLSASDQEILAQANARLRFLENGLREDKKGKRDVARQPYKSDV